tara:strand:- start:73 stop:297 length:225 start_codon:yes stop_codon:yes gene_type:complete
MGLGCHRTSGIGCAGNQWRFWLDPYWPLTNVSLDKQFELQNEIGKDSVLLKAAEWGREDIRDPDSFFDDCAIAL